MAKKKVALIIWSLTISGGGARQILELALSLQKKGHLVNIFCVNLDREKCFPHLVSQLTMYSINDETKRETHLLAKYSMMQKILYLFPHFLNKRHNLLQLRDLIKKFDTKTSYDVFNYHETEVYKLAEYFDRDKNFWMMNDLFVTGENLFETWYRKWTHLEYRLKYKRRMNRIIVLDNINKRIIRKYLHSDAQVVRSGLNQKDFYFTRTYKTKKKISILATGIFFPHRRYEDLIGAMNILINEHKHKNISLNIIGEPKTDLTYYEKIVALTGQYKIQSYVIFLGRVTESELKEQYRNADIFVFPNSPQTWGLAVFEAMLAGCVAIVSKGAGAHEVLKDDETAFLVNPGSPSQIALKIKQLLDKPELIQQISKSGQAFVQKNISWDKYSENMLVVFDRPFTLSKKET